VDGACAGLASPVNEVGRGIDGAAGTNDEHQRGFCNFALDARHLKGYFTEEHNMRAQTASARAATDLVEAGVDGAIVDRRAAALALAAGFRKLAVHVDQIFTAGAFVQVVDVLRAEKKAAASTQFELRFELGQRYVRGVGL